MDDAVPNQPSIVKTLHCEFYKKDVQATPERLLNFCFAELPNFLEAKKTG
jgi:hypothetical protein